jgi:hypothetical protein
MVACFYAFFGYHYQNLGLLIFFLILVSLFSFLIKGILVWIRSGSLKEGLSSILIGLLGIITVILFLSGMAVRPPQHGPAPTSLKEQR